MNPSLSIKKMSSSKWPNLIFFISQFTKDKLIDLKIRFMNKYFFRGFKTKTVVV